MLTKTTPSYETTMVAEETDKEVEMRGLESEPPKLGHIVCWIGGNIVKED